MADETLKKRPREPLPEILFRILNHETETNPGVVGWSEDGDAFQIFDEEVRFFRVRCLPNVTRLCM